MLTPRGRGELHVVWRCRKSGRQDSALALPPPPAAWASPLVGLGAGSPFRRALRRLACGHSARQLSGGLTVSPRSVSCCI